MYQLTASPAAVRKGDLYIPADPLNRDYAEYLDWLAAGNTPDPHILPQPTPAALAAAVQTHLDTTARARGYDSALSCVSYLGSTVSAFAADAIAMRDWRDAVWLLCEETLAEVQAGQRPVPTEQELLATLPPIYWPPEGPSDVTYLQQIS
jgi:hypothetical protein